MIGLGFPEIKLVFAPKGANPIVFPNEGQTLVVSEERGFMPEHAARTNAVSSNLKV